jgi:hypothetical protein
VNQRNPGCAALRSAQQSICTNDPFSALCIFAKSHVCVCEKVESREPEGSQARRINFAFCPYFLAVWKLYRLASTAEQGDDAPAEELLAYVEDRKYWSSALLAISKKRLRLYQLLLIVRAHILDDLPHALREAGAENKSEFLDGLETILGCMAELAATELAPKGSLDARLFRFGRLSAVRAGAGIVIQDWRKRAWRESRQGRRWR